MRPMMKIFLTIFSGLIAAAIAAPASTTDPSVSLPSGSVVGTVTSLPTGGLLINKYFGVPLAKSPPLRFAPPEPAEPWASTLLAQQSKSACIQQFNYFPPHPQEFHHRLVEFLNDPPLPESEDCLYVNVFTPATAAPPEGRTVMVFLYGCTLQIGGNNVPYYDGSSLAANQDVVVVVPDYRLGPFGFSNAPEIPFGDQNIGFLDQRFALDWVQKNIAAFGGDPQKVTIFGESAGALSVKQLVTLPPEPLPFRGAIMESFPAFPTNGTTAWQTLVRKSNCSGRPSELDCVRAVPALTVKSIAEHNFLGFNLVADNITMTAGARPYFEDGSAATVPILMVDNADEGSVFAWVAGSDDPSTNVRAMIRATYPHEPRQQQAIFDAYHNQLNNSLAFTSRYDGDTTFSCPLAAFTDLLEETRYNAWRYYYNATFPNLHPFPESGTYHSSELPIVFGTYAAGYPTAAERQLSCNMQTVWANFAKEPTRGPGWSSVENGKDVRVIGGRNDATVYSVKRERVDGICSIYPDILKGPQCECTK